MGLGLGVGFELTAQSAMLPAIPTVKMIATMAIRSPIFTVLLRSLNTTNAADASIKKKAAAAKRATPPATGATSKSKVIWNPP